MFRASMRQSLGENYRTYATLALVILYAWRLVCWLDLIQQAEKISPTQSDKYQCRIDTVIFS